MIITRYADNWSDVLRFTGTADFTVTVVKAFEKRALATPTLNATESQRTSIATEEISLNGILSVSQSQFSTNHHRFKKTPTISANQAPILMTIK